MKPVCPPVSRPSILALLLLLPTLLLSLSGALLPHQSPRTPGKAAIEHNNLGVGYMNQYAFKDAAVAFRKALSADASFTLARVNLGIALFHDQDPDEALRVLQEAEKTEPLNPYVHFVLGLIYKNRGESGKAAEHFLKVARTDESCATNHYNLGLIYARQRREKEAEAEFRRALALDPNHTSAMYNLGGLLIKTGRQQEGNLVFEQFRILSQKGGASSGMGSGAQYGEMGEYAIAMDYRPPVSTMSTPAVPPDAMAPLVDRSDDAGLAGLRLKKPRISSPQAGFDVSRWNPELLKTELLPSLGGGVSLADLNGDGSVDAVLTRYNAERQAWQTIVLLNHGKGRFQDISETSGVRNSGSQVSAAVGDFDNDGLPDICLVGLGGNRFYRNLGRGRFEDVTARAGVADDGLCISATFVDYDHDGDLDLYVCHYADVSRTPRGGPVRFPDSFPGAPNRVFRNNGDGSFTDYTERLGIGGGKQHSTGMLASDFDNDRDIDLLVLHEDSPPQLFSNERGDRFRDVSAQALAGIAGGYRSATIADFDRDGAMDIFLTSGAGRPNLVLMNNGKGILQPDDRSPALLSALTQAPRFGCGLLDFDNDGDLDLYLFGRAGSVQGMLWHISGDGRFTFAGRLPVEDGRGSAAADFNGDGKVDLLYLDATGSPHMLFNEAKSAGHWIGVQLEGLSSNKAGFGSKVEIRSGIEYQKFEVGGHNGFLSQDSAFVWLELGSSPKADTITVRWPSGILQSELNVAADKVVHIKELDRKGTSCPLLYSWNGDRYEFVTDFLGGSAIGYLETPGQYSIPDTDEYVRIEGGKLAPKDGKYLLNLNNQLEEVIMFDQAQLLVVDHPEGTEIYPNERLMPEPPFPEFRILSTRGASPPLSAIDQSGQDVLDQISRLDRVCATGFHNLRFKGYADPHSLTLDLGDLVGAKKVLLLLDGWIDYADSTANLAAAQAGLSLQPPYLQVRDQAGRWQTVLRSMGFPAGLPKTMTVDLTGKFLSGDHRVRIVTNMRIFWDRIRVDTSEEARIRLTRLDAASADLHFRGYPTYYTPDGRLPKIYDYGRIRPVEQWKTHAGAYTRFGDVRELLRARDDRYVITRHGDEISLAFNAAVVPELPKGWTRDYLLYADGYGKDMDINSLCADTVGPLPFHGMSKFPYPESERYPDDEEHRRYQFEYNTRVYPLGSEPLLLTGGRRFENRR